ncbi:N-acetylmuramoyl-L-alanine amidase, partial [bacterium]|nr:N-acetylmuramoyl-L-alanine amidase [bacterium]
MNIVEGLLPYWQLLQERDPQLINLVVIHCTELPDMKMAREFGERIIYSESGTGVSGHYYIDRDGSIFRYVPEDRIANHVIGHN